MFVEINARGETKKKQKNNLYDSKAIVYEVSAISPSISSIFSFKTESYNKIISIEAKLKREKGQRKQWGEDFEGKRKRCERNQEEERENGELILATLRSSQTDVGLSLQFQSSRVIFDF